MHSTYIMASNPPTALGVGVSFPILPVRKLRLTKVTCLAQGHTASSGRCRVQKQLCPSQVQEDTVSLLLHPCHVGVPLLWPLCTFNLHFAAGCFQTDEVSSLPWLYTKSEERKAARCESNSNVFFGGMESDVK